MKLLANCWTSAKCFDNAAVFDELFTGVPI